MVMAQAINLCFDLESTINYAQTRNTKHKCDLTINCVCKNFTQKDSDEKIEKFYSQNINLIFNKK